MIHLQKYVPNKTKDVNLKVFNLLTRINESKTLVKHIHAIVDANLMVRNVNQTKNGKMISVDVSYVVHAKKIVGILAHVFVKIVGT